MKHFALDVLQANKGDALVLRWGTENDQHTALIDGGPGSVWDDTIHPHLAACAGTDPAGQAKRIELDLVVVSHVDDDHIAGIIDLANAIETANRQAMPPPVTVAEVWHNSFADMEFLTDFDDVPELQQAIREAAVNPDSLRATAAPSNNDPTINDIVAGAQSVSQGRQLDRILRTVGLERNVSFVDRGGFARSGAPVELESLRITVIAPNTALLNKLKIKWRAELEKILEGELDKARRMGALAASFDDPSIPNQSSIVLLVEYEGCSMLLTGDVRGDHLIQALDDAGVPDPFHVDLLKVAHHGSSHSNSAELFRRVTADHYVISGNGEHGNPHPDTLRALFDTQAGRPITLYLTNRPTSGARRALDVQKAQEAEAVLDEAALDPSVTIQYRDVQHRAISVELA